MNRDQLASETGAWRDALLKAWERFNAELGWARSSHVALSMMFALFPFCIFVLSLAAQLSTGISEEDVVEYVFGSWPEEIAAPIVAEVLAVLDDSSPSTTVVSAVLALFFASNGVDAVRVSITHAYRETDPRPWWQTRLLTLIFVLCGAVILVFASLVAVGLPLYLRFVSDAAPDLYTRFFSSDPVRTATTLALLVFSVYAAHEWLPGVRRPLRTILPGVVMTIVLWIAAGSIFSAYLRSFESYSVTYAGLAGIMAALVFLYLMAAIFVFSAEFNGQLMRRNRAKRAKAS